MTDLTDRIRAARERGVYDPDKYTPPAATSPNRGESSFDTDALIQALIPGGLTMAMGEASEAEGGSGQVPALTALRSFLEMGNPLIGASKAGAELIQGAEPEEALAASYPMRDIYTAANRDPDRFAMSEGVAKGLSFGTYDNIQGRADAIAAGEGDNPAEYIDRANKKITERASLFGEIIGSMASGVGVAKGIGTAALKYSPQLAQATTNALSRKGLWGASARGAAATTAATAEGFVYALNEGKSVEEARKTAVLSGVLGGGATLSADVIGGITRIMAKNEAGPPSERIVRWLKAEFGDDVVKNVRGVELLDEATVRRLADSEDAVAFVEAMPKPIRTLVERYTKSTDDNLYMGTEALRSFIKTKADMSQPAFAATVDEVLRSGRILDVAQLKRATRRTREQLQKEYTRVLAPVQNVPVISTNELKQDIIGRFGEQNTGTMNAVKKQLIAMLGDLDEYTANDLLTLRKSLDANIFNKQLPASGSQQALSVDMETVTQYLVPFRNSINDLLHEQVPGLEAIDGLYSNAILTENAYKAGRQLAGGSDKSLEAMEAFMANVDARSASEVAAFLEGVKVKMAEDLTKKGTGAAAKRYFYQNRDRFQKIGEVFAEADPDGASGIINKLQESIETYAREQELGKMIPENTPAFVDPEFSLINAAIDLALVGRGAVSNGQGAGAAFALRRLLGGENPLRGTGELAQANAEELGMLLQKPMSEAPEAINQRVLDQLAPPFRPNALGLGLGFGTMYDNE